MCPLIETVFAPVFVDTSEQGIGDPSSFLNSPPPDYLDVFAVARSVKAKQSSCDQEAVDEGEFKYQANFGDYEDHAVTSFCNVHNAPSLGALILV